MHANALELWIPTELKELNSLYINSSRQIHPCSVKFNAVHRCRQTTEELRQVASQILHKVDGLHKINNDYLSYAAHQPYVEFVMLLVLALRLFACIGALH